MRTLLAVLTLLAALVPTPALSQTEPATDALLSDPAGDVAATVSGSPVPQAGTWTAVDLRALRLGEDPAGFRVEVQLEDLGEDGARPDYGLVNVHFAFGGAAFRVNLYRSQDNAAYFGTLYRGEGEQVMTSVRGVQVERDLTANTIWTTLDRFDLLGADGQAPGRGDVFGDFRVESFASLGSFLGSGVSRVGDSMPGDGAAHTVLFGGGESNGARLTTPAPFRSSNGEATVYQYDLTALHDGPEAARYRVFVENVPAGWNVTLPGTLLEVPAGKPAAFPIYVTTVFRHQHGTAQSFQVHLHEEAGERWASLDLGVNFLAVPQPSGHHPRLYVHSSDWAEAAAYVNAPLGSTNGHIAMNTLAEDPSDTRSPMIGRSEVMGANSPVNANNVGVSRYRWSACLEPDLRLGLDFDVAGVGTIEVPISATRPMPAAKLTGRLLHVGPGEPMQYCFPFYYQTRDTIVIAEFDAGRIDIAANGKATYTAAIQPNAEADYIAAQAGAGLVLELTLETIGMPAGGLGGANLEPGAWMGLPLNEYHDAVQVVVPQEGAPAAGFVAEGTAGKDAPAAPLPVAVGLLAALALLRRR